MKPEELLEQLHQLFIAVPEGEPMPLPLIEAEALVKEYICQLPTTKTN